MCKRILYIYLNKMNYPKIKIAYNQHLDPIFKGWFLSQPNFKDRKIPDKDFLDKQILMYKEQWDLYGDIVLKAICDITSLNFVRNHIDVHVVSDLYTPFSRPIVITSKYRKEQFITYMIHELIHCLSLDNNLKLIHYYPHPKKSVATHVVVHAIMQYVLSDVLKLPEYIQVDKDNCSKFPELGYKEAWEIVEKEGYMKLIEKFKLSIK